MIMIDNSLMGFREVIGGLFGKPPEAAKQPTVTQEMAPQDMAAAEEPLEMPEAPEAATPEQPKM